MRNEEDKKKNIIEKMEGRKRGRHGRKREDIYEMVGGEREKNHASAPIYLYIFLLCTVMLLDWLEARVSGRE